MEIAPDAHARMDDAVIEEACRWNNDSKAPHAHWIHLRCQPYSSGREVLVNLARLLPARGFVVLHLDAEENLSVDIPGPLAWSIFNSLAKRPLWRVKHAIDDFKRLPFHKKGLAFLLAIVSAPVLMVAVEAKNYIFNNPPDQISFRRFWREDVAKQWMIIPLRTLLEVAGIGAITAACVLTYRALHLRRPSWDGSMSPKFSDWRGYLEMMESVGARFTLAVLIDHAHNLPLFEGEIINHILKDTDFRILCISEDLPRNLRLGKVRQRTFDLPKLPPEVLADERAKDERIRGQVAEKWARDEGKRVEGTIGSFEWTAFCALLDRRWLPFEEIKKLYSEIVASPVLPLIGLPGPHPSKPPIAKLRDDSAPKEIFDSVWCSMEQSEIEIHRPDLLAKARCMLIVFGLNLHPHLKIWRKWDPERIRTLLQSAGHAADLADETPLQEIWDNILVGIDSSKANLLSDITKLLVTASEISIAYGYLRRATYFLQSAAKWYGAIEKTMDRSLRDGLFYHYWNSFWFSLDPDDRQKIREFESVHPAVRDDNTWKILLGRENHLSRKNLWDQVPSDPGAANPELANVRNSTILNENLLRMHNNDYEEAAQSPGFLVPEVFAEHPWTIGGLVLLFRSQDLLVRRNLGNSVPARALWEKGLAEWRAENQPAWVGERLIIECEEHWKSYWDLVSSERTTEAEIEIDERRLQLSRDLEEIRETALVLGFRNIVRNASDLLAWTLMGENDEAGHRHVERIVEAEPYFQEVLDIESSLGWCIYAPKIYEKRLSEIAQLDQPSAISDMVALYTAMKKAGVPARQLRNTLNLACVLVGNNASTSEHRRAQGRLEEERAAIIELTPDDKSDWTMSTLQGQLVFTLCFAATGWISADELIEADRVLTQANLLLQEAERLLGKDHEDIRDARVSYNFRLAAIARKRNEREKYVQMLMRSWGEAHSSDVDASSLLAALIASEEEAGILHDERTIDEWSTISLNAAFAPTADLLVRHLSCLSRFHWRFLQLLSHESALRDRNARAFFRAVFTFASATRQSPLDEVCHLRLVNLLSQAEEYFRTGEPSNANEKMAIQLRNELDTSPDPERERRLREIAKEDRLLKIREDELRNAIAHGDWIEEFSSFGLKTSDSVPLDTERTYLAESVACIRSSKALIILGRTYEAFQMLSGRVEAIQKDHVRAVDLVLCHEWINTAPAQDREHLIRRRDALIKRFVVEHFGEDRSDLVEILRQRFDELR